MDNSSNITTLKTPKSFRSQRLHEIGKLNNNEQSNMFIPVHFPEEPNKSVLLRAILQNNSPQTGHTASRKATTTTQTAKK